MMILFFFMFPRYIYYNIIILNCIILHCIVLYCIVFHVYNNNNNNIIMQQIIIVTFCNDCDNLPFSLLFISVVLILVL